MAGITGLGTTYNLPNYSGMLFALTPTDTPFFSAIGGLSATPGGGQTTSPEFEWQAYDLRAAGQNVALEGATAPTSQERTRSNISNVCQIQQSTVAVSYTKLAATGLKSGVNNDLSNPVTNELDWQLEQELKAMVRDIEWSFINGTYQKPSDNTTARKTRGLLQSITTNVTNFGTAVTTGVTGTAATDLVNKTSHGLANDKAILFTVLTGGTGLALDTVYYVITSTTNTFQVSRTVGGPAVDILTDYSALNYTVLGDLTYDRLGELMQGVYDNGGITEQGTAALMAPSHLKRKVSKVLASAFAGYQETSRNVGGVNMTVVTTDFGELNLVTNRHMPRGTLAVVSLEQCQPVYLDTPSKGHFFAEPLAKTGANESTMLYGEVGLAYGSELSHGKLLNVA